MSRCECFHDISKKTKLNKGNWTCLEDVSLLIKVAVGAPTHIIKHQLPTTEHRLAALPTLMRPNSIPNHLS